MMHKNSLKTKRALEILRNTGIYFYIKVIAWRCAIDAFGENIHYNYGFQTHEKSGWIRFFENDLYKNVRNLQISSDKFSDDVKRHFEEGFRAKAFYDFGLNGNLNLKLILRDNLVSRPSVFYNLFVDMFFEDFDIGVYDSISVTTQPFIDPEDAISETLIWRELQR